MTEHLEVAEGKFTVRFTEIPHSVHRIMIYFRSEAFMEENDIRLIIKTHQKSVLDLIRKHCNIIDSQFRPNYHLTIYHLENLKIRTKAIIYQHQFIYKSQCHDQNYEE